MSRELSVAVAVDGHARRDTLARMFPTGGALRVVSAHRVEAGAFLRADTAHLDAIVVACGAPTAEVIAFVRTAAHARPWLPLIVACDPDGEVALHELLAAGADDIVPVLEHSVEDSLRLRFALEKARAVRAGSLAGERAVRPAEVVTVVGPKGGTGKTITTCNTAAALAQAGKRVVIIDIDLQFGDVGLALGLRPERTIHDLATAGGSLDAEMLCDYLTQHPSGVRVLCAPVRPDQAGSVTPELVRDAIEVLSRMCDVVIVDTPPGFTPEVIAAIDAASSLWVVAGMDALSLKNTRLALDTLDLMGCPADSMRLVLNRANSRVGVDSGAVHALLGRKPDIRVPSHRDIVCSVNEGHPIVLSDPGCEASRAFTALAVNCLPPEDAPEAKPRRLSLRRRRSQHSDALVAA